ncbi:MAG: regulatory signaling modulator protein AmpE [Pseudohongiellaceae bacterium]
MKFLAVLISVGLNYFWQSDLDRFDDSWFIKYRRRLETLTGDTWRDRRNGWILAVVLVIGVPVILLGLILLVVDSAFFGLLTLLIHVTVLLVAMDRTHPGQLARAYLESWRDGDQEACYLYLERELGAGELPEIRDFTTLHSNFIKSYVYVCLEKMFVMLFWYLLAGPMAVLFCYLLYQYRDSSDERSSPEGAALATGIIHVIEWLPVRLLGLTFALAGDFERGFTQLRESPLNSGVDARDLAVDYALGAMPAEFRPPREGESFSEYQAHGEEQVLKLQGLLERSQIIWLCLIALMAIFGLSIV